MSGSGGALGSVIDIFLFIAGISAIFISFWMLRIKNEAVLLNKNLGLIIKALSTQDNTFSLNTRAITNTNTNRKMGFASVEDLNPRDHRIEFRTVADISDGTLVFYGTVSNITRTGFMISDVPPQFDFYSSKWVAIINGIEKSVKLLIKPRWSKTLGIRKEVGFQIISPPLNWVKFINKLDDREVAISSTLH